MPGYHKKKFAKCEYFGNCIPCKKFTHKSPEKCLLFSIGVKIPRNKSNFCSNFCLYLNDKFKATEKGSGN